MPMSSFLWSALSSERMPCEAERNAMGDSFVVGRIVEDPTPPPQPPNEWAAVRRACVGAPGTRLTLDALGYAARHAHRRHRRDRQRWDERRRRAGPRPARGGDRRARGPPAAADLPPHALG